ncbi:MAG: RNA methyltransferase [Terracidiphilus sp.]
MPLRIVQSQQNARLKELRRALAQPGREPTGLVGIEGPHLVTEALRAGLRLRCVFAAQDAESLLDPLHLPVRTEVLLLPREILSRALTTETPQPIAALIEPPCWNWSHVLGAGRKTAPLLLVLAGLQDPGNLGTILRSAEAFGADGILSLPGTVSPWNPKAMRASAGSVLRVPFLAVSEREAFTRLREAGVRTYVTTPLASHPADLVNLAEPAALLIGNEGNGVPEELAAKADQAITIPCPGPVESLNAAVAASVLLYEAARQRAKPSGGPPNHRGDTR